MGFQASDLAAFASSLSRMPGVVGVWLLAPAESEATMWAVVSGFDAQAHNRRLEIRERVEKFLGEHQDAMIEGAFAFDYHVLVDHPELGEVQIPAGAERAA